MSRVKWRAMVAVPENSRACATAEESGGVLVVVVSGVWRITAPRPTWVGFLAGRTPRRVGVEVAGLEKWDSSLLLFLFEVQQWCRVAGVDCNLEDVPQKMRTLLGQLETAQATSVPFNRSESFLTSVGAATLETSRKVAEFSRFVGDFVLSTVQFVRSPHKFRWRDCLNEMQQCGAMALPIVRLISFLVGVTLAYTGAIVLRQ